MKLLTANFLTCPIKKCSSEPAAFPLRFSDAEIEQLDNKVNPKFILGVLPRIEWTALVTTTRELGFTNLPESKPEGELSDELIRDLHEILVQTHVKSGKMTCRNCERVYEIKEGVANLLITEEEE
ncbi:Multifunctional methyltransferase subunit trm112 [Neolecta irregularis DAH-3]|uniref:Multifunctional methyltransferase subunit trm112 n=1 Tax=Neolecta irregularis (strain DAH-3) TaxID=1198029 RepID=A0A1U7LSN9_NEOID|nr:Multifunctional methyltransferase subunit trm112 [Neolecta irregularis DAH-3]|eukprot:OLL25677.1 Multifunctional methyltransferase subunit trm112 [Neolecta irregularis DAH-3]